MKVVVIADDLTGAAELAGAAADLGFSAEVQTQFDPRSDADVVAIDTDTRTLKPADGATIVARVASAVQHTTSAWIYKKTDSVLRGNVRAEIEAILDVSGLTTAIYLPANPLKGRVIREGTYHVGGVPLAETAFANDPHHPRTSSNVWALLGASKDSRIAMPDVENTADLITWAQQINSQTLPAGGVEFFGTMLQQRLGASSHVARETVRTPPILLVCGSPQARADGRLEQFESHGIPVLLMPIEVAGGLSGDDAGKRWATSIGECLRNHQRCAAMIGDLPSGSISPGSFSIRLAETIAYVLRDGSISTVCIEGGATAAAVLQRLGCTRLLSLPATRLPGAAAMQSADLPRLTFVVKPGSYPWPVGIFGVGK